MSTWFLNSWNWDNGHYSFSAKPPKRFDLTLFYVERSDYIQNDIQQTAQPLLINRKHTNFCGHLVGIQRPGIGEWSIGFLKRGAQSSSFQCRGQVHDWIHRPRLLIQLHDAVAFKVYKSLCRIHLRKTGKNTSTFEQVDKTVKKLHFLFKSYMSLCRVSDLTTGSVFR